MIAVLGTNRAGAWCVVYPDDCKDAYPTRELAANAVRRANAQVRVQAHRLAHEQAMTSLGALSMRLRVGLALMPTISQSSAAIAAKCDFVRG